MVIIDSREAVEEYLNHDRIECLVCGKRTSLARRAYRAMQREKMNRLIADGIVTHDHLNNLIENNKTKGRGEKREYDLNRQK